MNEIVEKRTRRSKTFDLGGGKYRLETGNHSHANKSGLWLPADISVESEAGTDSDVSMNYIARSRFEFLDYDIRFGKNDPVWMKIKHLPSGKTVVFKPQNNNNRPDHTIQGNKILVSQAWDGIDMEIFVTDFGVKTNYIITSAAGQRVVEFKVSGDVGNFKSSPPWYVVAGDPVPKSVPRTISSGIMSYDFRSVPIGVKIDPSFSVQTDDTSTKDTSFTADSPILNSHANGYPWLGIGQLSGVGPTKVWRTLIAFDLSAITDTSVTVTNAEMTLYTEDGTAGTHSYELHRIRRSNWSEVNCCWNFYLNSNYWDGVGASDTSTDIFPDVVGSGSHSGHVSNAANIITGLDADLETILSDQSVYYGWRLNGDEGASLWFQFKASSTANAAYRPKLAFDYIVNSGGGGSVVTPGFGAGKPYPFARGRGWK